ncbi:MAG: hypothetical protein ACLFTT_16785 [Candidatus Hydrogenedentota bacterium]
MKLLVARVTTTLLFLVFAANAQEPPLYEDAAEKSHTELITARDHTYYIDVGGDLDMDNTATRRHSNWEIAFQNNVELSISNVGGAPVKNPRIITNGARRFHSWESMLAEFTEGATSDQERIYLIWEGLRQHRHHDYPLFSNDEYHDPVRFLNIYGGGFCDDAGKVGSALYYGAGFTGAGAHPPFVRALHGHMMCEVWHDGAYQFMDIDQDTFYLDWYNKKPVSGDTVARDHYLAIREQAYGPTLGDWDTGPHNAAALFGADDGKSSHGVLGHGIDMTLRPGEQIVYRWDNRGKYPWQREDIAHRYYGNAQLVYEPPISEPALFEAEETYGFTPMVDGVQADTYSSRIIIATQTPYTICGGTLHFTWNDPTHGGALQVAVARDGGEFETVWQRETGRGSARESIALDEALGVEGGPALRNYRVRIAGLDIIQLRITNIRIETDLYAYPIALPRLSVGANKVAYSDDTEAPHAVDITYKWREAEARTGIPQPPAAPEIPAHAATVRRTKLPLRWPAVEGAELYWVRVSRAPHMRYPYRPNYDVYLDENTYEVPYNGMFNHGETYYWQVRPRRNGVWGAWSPRWRFTWQGPMPPRDVRIETHPATGRLVLLWEANPEGVPPAAYRVYGSDMRGFIPSTEPLDMPAIGETPATLAADNLSETRFVIDCGETQPDAPCLRAYYRVSAVDAEGVESGASPQAVTPRPWLYNLPETPIMAGKPFERRLKTVRSLGDVQYRYESPGHAFWETEAHTFTLKEGPPWIELEPETGRLRGTPPADAVGEHMVTVHVATTFPEEVPADAKSGADFAKVIEEYDTDYARTFTLRVEAPAEDAP